MAILSVQTIVGNVGKVYELRTVGRDNTPVLDFSVAVTPRKRDGDEWKDGETYWVTVTAWNKLAENIEKSFNSGDRVFVYGRIEMKDGYTNREGQAVPPRPIMIADFAGLEVSYAPAESKRVRGGGNGGGNGGQRSSGPAPARREAPKAAPKAADEDLFADDDFSFGEDDDAPF